MKLQQTRNLGRSVEITSANRPIKVAYLVPAEESAVTHMILDAVFYESYTRWGGIYTLIIPCKRDAFLRDTYAAWLQFFDPDFVYTYVQLSERFIESIDRLCLPVAFLRHEREEQDMLDCRWRDFIHEWTLYFTAVSSRSTVASPSATHRFFSQPEGQQEVTVATQYSGSPQERLLTDNFGTAFHTHIVTHAVPGLYKTLCLVPPDLPEYIDVGTERCASISEMLLAVANRQALTVAGFARANSEAICRPEPRAWTDNLNLFVGNTALDRIDFWNSRHFTPGYATTPGALIVPPDLFDKQELLTALGQYLNKNNFLGQQNSSPKVLLRSSSVDLEQLSKIRDALSKKTYNFVIAGKNCSAPAVPDEDDLKRVHVRSTADTFVFKVTEESNTLIAQEPAHFAYIPPRFRGIVNGQWMIDLDIQRHNNLSKYSNVVDKWALPRRRKISRAFSNNLGKVTNLHRLTLLPTTESYPFDVHSANRSYSVNVSLPDDEIFFRHLVLDAFTYPADDLRSTIKKESYKDLSISDKGQNLRGVISMFGKLAKSYSVLTNKFWREVIRSAKQDSVKYLVFSQGQLERFLPADRENKVKLIKEQGFSNVGSVKRFLKASLLDSLEYLVRTNVFYQVHQWRCAYCGHTNSRNFDGMKIKNSCEICNNEYFAPIDLRWEYQLNEFVHRSLVKHTGLPVLWTLGFLQERLLTESFWYLPEVDLYERYDDPGSKSEIDILCMLDGKFYAVEVKLSASQFIDKPSEFEKYVRKMNLIRPDVALLSFERYSESVEHLEASKTALKETANLVRKGLMADIRLEVLVASDVPEFTDYSAELGFLGRRARAI